MGLFDFLKGPKPIISYDYKVESQNFLDKITAQTIEQCFLCGLSTAKVWVLPLVKACEAADIKDANRTAYFFAQLGHESGSFTEVDENLNYSATRLSQIFPRKFNQKQAEEYAHNPKKIANRVYANMIGNGNEESGDGYRYHGRGLINLTGKSNYEAAGKALGMDFVSRPEMLLDPMTAALVSAWFWNARNLNKFSDAGDIEGQTKVINGGLNGIEDRKMRLSKCKEALKNV